MDKRTTRRGWLTLCSVGTVAGLAGCTGSDDSSQTGDGDSGVDDAGDSSDTGGDATDGGDGEPLTLVHNTKTGRYVFEGSDRVGDNTDTLVWDVQSIDGFDATVEASFEEAWNTEEFSLTASPDAPEVTPTNPYMIGVDEDLSDYLSTQFVELWFPNLMIGDVDLRSLAVGDEPDGHSSFNFEVVDTRTHAGIECYVIDASVIGGGDVSYSYCVSPEHAMVISAANHDHGYELELVEYDGH